MKKYSKLIIVAILFIKLLYLIKGLPPMDIQVYIPVIITCLVVTTGKVLIFYGVSLGAKKVIDKVKKDNDDVDNKDELTKEKVLENDYEKNNKTLELNVSQYKERNIIGKPKVLVKKYKR